MFDLQDAIRFLVFPSGVSLSVKALAGMIAQHQDNLLGVWRFWSVDHKMTSYTYVAAFEQGLGDYLCVVAPDGAGEGEGYVGEGYVAHRFITALLDERDIEFEDHSVESQDLEAIMEILRNEVALSIASRSDGWHSPELVELHERVLEKIRRERGI